MTYSRCVRPLRRAIGSALVACLATAGPAAAQIVHSKILPLDTLAEGSGLSQVELGPDQAFVSALREDTGVTNSGGIFVYAEVGDGWQFNQLLKAPQPKFEAGFGHALAVSGEWLLTSEHWNDWPDPFAAGAAHVFRRVGSTWIHHQILTPHDAAEPGTEGFGVAVDIDGATLVIGNAFDQSAGTMGGGSAYVFELVGQTWTETAKLVPASQDLVPGAYFGNSVAVLGDTIVVGAQEYGDGVPNSDRGAAFVFQRNSGAWSQTQKLEADDAHYDANFGHALALQGETLLVGAIGHDHTGTSFYRTGAVYVFDLVAGTWTQTQELRPPIPVNTEIFSFGRDVDLDGNLAVVGSPRDGDLGSSAGCAFVFRREGSQWELFGKALAPDGFVLDLLASDVKIRGTRILLSAPEYEEEFVTAKNNGAAFDFDLAPDAAQYGSCFNLGPCGNGDKHGGCVHSGGHGAVLQASGSSSVSEDALALEARWLPSGVLGILFIGGGEQSVPFGDGRLVVGAGTSGVFRILPPKSSGAQGVMLWDGGLVTTTQSHPPAGQIEAGDTWYAQVWYRDPIGPCGSGYNTTNGLKIDFKP
jgi:hypothetical protein